MPMIHHTLTHHDAPALTPRDFDFKALAVERARFDDAIYEKNRVNLYERASLFGENFYHIAMSYAPWRWADLYNNATDEQTELDALCALEVWGLFDSGAYKLREDEVKS